MTTVKFKSNPGYGLCQPFVIDAWDCGLLRSVHLQAIQRLLVEKPQTEPGQLANWLVQKDILSRFQAEQVLAGKGRDLIFWVFLLVEPIGSGSLGTVYKARDKVNGRLFAIKLVPRRDAFLVTKTQPILQAFRDCRHPVVVPILHLGTVSDHHYLVWPFVNEGQSLPTVVKQQGPLPVARAVDLVCQAAEGLHACHQFGLVHGLLKPSDIRILPDGQIRVLNFGQGLLLAEQRRDSVFNTECVESQITSAMSCVCPETLMDPTVRTPASDQYSLGCLLYFALTGRFPFPCTNPVQRLMAQQENEPASLQEQNPEVPAWLETVVRRLLACVPEERYRNLSEVRFALENGGATPRIPVRTVVREAEPSGIGPPSELNSMKSAILPASTTSPPRRQPRQLSWVVYVLGLLLLGVVLGWFLV